MVDTGQPWAVAPRSAKGSPEWGCRNRRCAGAAAGKPVIIEDGCFIGSRCIVVEGYGWKRGRAGHNVVLTQSTKIIDVSGSDRGNEGVVPARSNGDSRNLYQKIPGRCVWCGLRPDHRPAGNHPPI